MKLKKLLTGAAALTMTVLLLSACGSDKKDDGDTSTSTSETTKESSTDESKDKTASDVKLEDGTYKLEEKNYSHGYRVVFTIEVKDGKIVESDYDYVNEKGESKKDDAEYNKSMQDKSGTAPEKYIPELNEELVKTQNPADVEVVTGATHSSDAFKEYAQKLIDAAEKGDTKTIEIDNKTE